MNNSRLIGGIICLAVAALLGVLAVVLPADQMVFMLGDANVPWVPAVVLGIVGIVLLVTSSGEKELTQSRQTAQPAVVQDPAKVVLNKRLETIGWGCFLIMLGGFALVPNAMVPKGLWSVGVGMIMLGLNGARYLNHIKMSGFTTFLGILAIISGIAEMIGVKALEGAAFLIILGAYLILKPWFEQRQLFGKAES